MLILGRDQLKDPSLGYARTFVRQVEDCLGLALRAGRADRQQRRRPQPGRPRRPAARGRPRARARPGDRARRGRRPARRSELGWRGRAHRQRLPRRLRHRRRADRRRRRRRHRPRHRRLARRRTGGRRTSAGRPTSYDELAGAVVAGHVLECGTQATGGNFSGFRTLPHRDQPLGFPVAEIAADGSSVITKHDGTGGAVTVDTVTAQLVYEIQSTRYLGPDVTVAPRHRPARAGRPGPGRRSPGCRRGAAGAAQGLRQRARRLPQHRRARAHRPRRRGEGGLGPRAARGGARPRSRPPPVDLVAHPVPHADADTEEAASCLLRCTVKDPSRRPGRQGVHGRGRRARARRPTRASR